MDTPEFEAIFQSMSTKSGEMEVTISKGKPHDLREALEKHGNVTIKLIWK